ncbi:MAG: toxin-antitoxin system protein [Actinomycetota bacterium]|nr:toxin-antitoxin system protein [Actinomycetota bacterium]
MTRMVRASDETLERLRRLREVTGDSTADLLERAVELLEHDRFLDAANTSFAKLRDHPDAWREERRERELWEETLADGFTEDG